MPNRVPISCYYMTFISGHSYYLCLYNLWPNVYCCRVIENTVHNNPFYTVLWRSNCIEQTFQRLWSYPLREICSNLDNCGLFLLPWWHRQTTLVTCVNCWHYLQQEILLKDQNATIISSAVQLELFMNDDHRINIVNIKREKMMKWTL